jgi:hypothetical protein
MLLSPARCTTQLRVLDYLLRQLRSRVPGRVATGVMLVVLLGHRSIDPWVVTIGGMMSTAAAEHDRPARSPFHSPSPGRMGVFSGIGIASLCVDDLHPEPLSRRA